MNLILSPNNGNVLTDAPVAGMEAEWMENKYRNANDNARIAEPLVPVFEHVSFLKTDLQRILNQPENKFVAFTHMNVKTAGQTVSTLMALGVSDVDLIQVGPADHTLVACHFNRPKFTGALDLFEFSQPKRTDRKYAWKFSGFNGKTLEEIMTKLIKPSFDHGNMFASVRFHRDDLMKIMEPAGCEKVVFIPIKMECRIEESFLGVREISFQEDVTLIAAPIDAGDNVLPLVNAAGTSGVAFSADGWPPNYPHWQ